MPRDARDGFHEQHSAWRHAGLAPFGDRLVRDANLGSELQQSAAALNCPLHYIHASQFATYSCHSSTTDACTVCG